MQLSLLSGQIYRLLQYQLQRPSACELQMSDRWFVTPRNQTIKLGARRVWLLISIKGQWPGDWKLTFSQGSLWGWCESSRCALDGRMRAYIKFGATGAVPILFQLNKVLPQVLRNRWWKMNLRQCLYSGLLGREYSSYSSPPHGNGQQHKSPILTLLNMQNATQCSCWGGK